MIDGEEQLIIGQAVRGEPSAFGILYDRYQPALYRFIVLKVGRREEAEDLTHQVFLHAWQKIRGYEDRGYPFSAWLYQIARNLVIDFYRTQKGDVPLVVGDEVGEERFATPATDLEKALDTSFDIERVMRVLRTLQPDHQDVVIMRFVEDMTVEEVARALKKSEGAVKLMQHRALKELKKKIPIHET